MITREQIDEHCDSGLLWAKLDRDYKADRLDYILPAGTIVQVELYKRYSGNLRLNGRYIVGDLYLNSNYIDGDLPYDAATLLEE